MLSEKRNMEAAQRFIKQAVVVVGHTPESVTTDGHGFETFEAAARFCCAFDELRNYLRPYPIMGETISLSERRRAFIDRLVALQVLLQSAS